MLGMSQSTTFAMVSLKEPWRMSTGEAEVTAPGPRDGIAIGILFVLGFRCVNGPEEGVSSV